MAQRIGYKRVSTVDQSTDRQLDGMEFAKVFEDKASGKDTKRPALQECLAYLREGDTLVVHSIDRLARNLADLEKMVANLNAKGVAVQFVKESLTFAGQESPMNRLMFQMLGAFAEFERALSKERQMEGIAKAKENGKHLGREAKLTATQMAELRERAATGWSKTVLAAEYNVSRATVYNVLKG